MGSSDVLVLGAGIAGIRASLELAGLGVKVFLLERDPFLGGKLPSLDVQFPTDRCCMCQMLSSSDGRASELCLKRSFSHPLIDTVLCAEPLGLSGEKGNFTVSFRVNPRGVDIGSCTSCGRCIDACPVEVRDLKSPGGKRKAIYMREEAYPPVPAIDWSSCTRCGACVDACPTGAIGLDSVSSETNLRVGYILLASGFDLVSPRVLSQYGYGRFRNVVTGIELERMLSPTGMGLSRPGDGKEVKRMAFVLCAGSREVGSEFCSTTCCMYSLRQAYMAKGLFGDVDITIFYMDLRAYGDYHSYAMRAKDLGVRLVRSRIPRVLEDPSSGDVLLSYLRDGRPVEEAFDMVVLATGARPSKEILGFARSAGVELDRWGFIKVKEPFLETTKDGVYACGAATGPKDIRDSVVDAMAASSGIMRDLKKTGVFVEGRAVGAEKIHSEGGVGVVLCSCGGELDVEKLRGLIAGSGISPSDIVEVRYLCRGEMSDTSRFSRLVVGACSPYLFRERFLEQSGFSREDVEWVNIKALLASGGLFSSLSSILFSYETLRRREVYGEPVLPSKGSVLVVGGGFSGLIAATSMASLGLSVHLVEKGESLGGSLRERPSKKEFLEDLLRRVRELGISVHLGCEVESLEGCGGGFTASLRGPDGRSSLGVGAVVLATGSLEVKPSSFGYGSDKRVVVQRELEEMIFSGDLGPVKRVVMIQCVESRDREHPWCSRYCCVEAIENAIKLRDMGIEVYIFHRDIMTYGLKEGLYLEAREKGVVFLRYEDLSDLEVSREGAIRIKYRPLGIDVSCDLLVLSTGEAPNPDNARIAEVFGVELGKEGFLLPADPKFRPLEATRSGIYLCGGCLGPYLWEEVAAQAAAVSGAVFAMLKGMRPRFPVAVVNPKRCSGCCICVESCPYGARVFDDELGFVKVESFLCQGCGVCVSICPNGATELSWGKKVHVSTSLERMLVGGLGHGG